MLPALTVILLCQLVGEAVARAAGLPLPGPVLGMVLLFLLLLARGRLAARGAKMFSGHALETVGGVLLGNLSLMFVPAGVGVIQRLDVLSSNGPALLAAILVSTLMAMTVAVGVFRLVARAVGNREDAPEPAERQAEP